MSKGFVRPATLLAIVAGLVAATTMLSPATAGDTSVSTMTQALRRDLNLTPEQAKARQARELAASRTAQRLRTELRDHYAGSWLRPEDQRLVVATTDADDAATIRAAGAEPELVVRTERQLNAVKLALDRTARPDPSQITGWYVDVMTNSVVVRARPGAATAARKFITAGGADSTAVRVVTSDEAPALLYDIRGGDAYFINGNTRCSVGFPIRSGGFPAGTVGFVTAGHCGTPSSTVAGFNGVALGRVIQSNFPGNDFGWVRTDGPSEWVPQPWVNNYAGGNAIVSGVQEAAIGSSVCRSGSTTGWRCGTILGKNETVVYRDGSAVTGLTRTNACAEGGDSGGSWLTGQEAQGVTSGGSGNCTTGGTTYFQPVLPILSTYGLALSSSGNSPPVITYISCDHQNGIISCGAVWNGGADPATATWAPVGGAVLTSQGFDAATHRTGAGGRCVAGQNNQFRLTLTDANGVTVTAIGRPACGRDPRGHPAAPK